MWAELNSSIKHYVPCLHRALKALFQATLASMRLPLPKIIAGQFSWVHPILLTEQITEPHVHSWIQEYLLPGQIFFDVGAHYGWMSMTAARAIGACGRVVAFEPAPVLIDILAYHKVVNRLKQMEIVPAAVSDADDSAVPFFLRNNGLSFGNTLLNYAGGRHRQAIKVSAVCLDSYCSKHNCWPDVLKIDIEGAELLALQGAAKLLSQRAPTLIIAIHPPWLPDRQSVEQLFELLSKYGYSVERSRRYPCDGHDFADYLFVKSSDAEHLACISRLRHHHLSPSVKVGASVHK